MTEWLKLNLLPVPTADNPNPDYYSKATRKAVDAINARIADLIESRQATADYHAALGQADVLDVDAVEVHQGDAPRMNRFQLIQQEVKIRRDLLDVIPLMEADRTAAWHQAMADLDAKRQWVREQLAALGYIDVPATTYIKDPAKREAKITPGMVNGNPHVAALIARVSNLRIDRSDLRREHKQAIGALTAELEAIRNKALAAA